MVSSSYTNEVQSSEMNFEPHFLFNGYQEIFSFWQIARNNLNEFNDVN